jgi:hypothetical protein
LANCEVLVIRPDGAAGDNGPYLHKLWEGEMDIRGLNKDVVRSGLPSVLPEFELNLKDNDPILVFIQSPTGTKYGYNYRYNKA